MKRLLIFCLLFCLSALLSIGCAVHRSDLGVSASQENMLSIFNWSDYIDPEVIAEFEQEFGVKVKYDTFDSNESLFAKIRPGNPGYDIIVPTNDYVEIMVKIGLLEELDRDNIPNIKNINSKFLNPGFDIGNKYSIPYQWGTVGIGYNITKTGGEIDSFEALFDPKFKNKVALLEDIRVVMGMVLNYLGYDPNTTDIDAIQAAKDYIVDRKETIATFAPDTGQTLLDQGEVDIALEYSGDIFTVMAENEDLRYVIPKEGSIVWTDSLAIPKGAPHKELAEKFINFVLDPEVGAKISNYVAYGTPNATAIEQGLIDEEILADPSIYPSPEVFEKLSYIHDVGKATTLYDDAWTEVKVSMW